MQEHHPTKQILEPPFKPQALPVVLERAASTARPTRELGDRSYRRPGRTRVKEGSPEACRNIQPAVQEVPHSRELRLEQTPKDRLPERGLLRVSDDDVIEQHPPTPIDVRVPERDADDRPKWPLPAELTEHLSRGRWQVGRHNNEHTDRRDTYIIDRPAVGDRRHVNVPREPATDVSRLKHARPIEHDHELLHGAADVGTWRLS
jgi:hypothetical protein